MRFKSLDRPLGFLESKRFFEDNLIKINDVFHEQKHRYYHEKFHILHL